MKSTIIFILAIFISITTLNAQEIDAPLKDRVSSEFVPEAPSSKHIYVKGHYTFIGGKYEWVNGGYVLGLENYTWVDAAWKKNADSGMYELVPGYWKSSKEAIMQDDIAYQPGEISELSVIEVM